ncbi:hypothetical protein D3261_01205 [Halococcus sp. IIIV-5B]|nr:hypothetical protein D3261_01205 [Halococcus sp. IIIV-5B]
MMGSYAVFFWLPVARGYVLFATPLSDSLIHLGIVRDVLSSGSIPDVIYPASHLLIALLASITDIKLTLFQPLVGYLFTLLLVLGILVSARRLLRSHTAGLYALLAGLPLLYASYHVVILPWFYTLTMFPIILYVADRWLTDRGDHRPYVMLFVFMTAIAFYHPMMCLLIAGLLVSYWGYLRLESWVPGQMDLSRRSVGPLVFLLLFPLAVITQWHLGLPRMQSRIGTILLAFQQGDQSAASFAGQAGQTSYTVSELLWEYLVLRWGPTVVYMGVGGLLLLAVCYRIWHRRTTIADRRIAALYLASFMTAIAALVVLRTRNPVRAVRFVLLIVVYLIALAFWNRHRIDSKLERWDSRVIVHSLLAIIVVVALLASGITYRGDAHLTETTIDGTTWHLEHQNGESITLAHRMARNIDIYQDGYREGRFNERVFTRYNATHQLPKHLGYDENETIATTLSDRRYLVTKYSDTQWYRSQPRSRYSELLFYNRSDAAALADDPAANRLYNNGDFDVWLAGG